MSRYFSFRPPGVASLPLILLFIIIYIVSIVVATTTTPDVSSGNVLTGIDTAESLLSSATATNTNSISDNEPSDAADITTATITPTKVTIDYSPTHNVYLPAGNDAYVALEKGATVGSFQELIMSVSTVGAVSGTIVEVSIREVYSRRELPPSYLHSNGTVRLSITPFANSVVYYKFRASKSCSINIQFKDNNNPVEYKKNVPLGASSYISSPLMSRRGVQVFALRMDAQKYYMLEFDGYAGSTFYVYGKTEAIPSRSKNDIAITSRISTNMENDDNQGAVAFKMDFPGAGTGTTFYLLVECNSYLGNFRVRYKEVSASPFQTGTRLTLSSSSNPVYASKVKRDYTYNLKSQNGQFRFSVNSVPRNWNTTKFRNLPTVAFESSYTGYSFFQLSAPSCSGSCSDTVYLSETYTGGSGNSGGVAGGVAGGVSVVLLVVILLPTGIAILVIFLKRKAIINLIRKKTSGVDDETKEKEKKDDSSSDEEEKEAKPKKDQKSTAPPSQQQPPHGQQWNPAYGPPPPQNYSPHQQQGPWNPQGPPPPGPGPYYNNSPPQQNAPYSGPPGYAGGPYPPNMMPPSGPPQGPYGPPNAYYNPHQQGPYNPSGPMNYNNNNNSPPPPGYDQMTQNHGGGNYPS